jgi:hypothetical protein
VKDATIAGNRKDVETAEEVLPNRTISLQFNYLIPKNLCDLSDLCVSLSTADTPTRRYADTPTRYPRRFPFLDRVI